MLFQAWERFASLMPSERRVSPEKVTDIHALRAVIAQEIKAVEKGLAAKGIRLETPDRSIHFKPNFILSLFIVEHFGAQKIPRAWANAREAILDFNGTLEKGTALKLLYTDSRYNIFDKGLAMMRKDTYDLLRNKYPEILRHEYKDAIRDLHESVRMAVLLVYENRLAFDWFVQKHPKTFKGKPEVRLRFMAAVYNCSPDDIMRAVRRAEEDAAFRKRKGNKSDLRPWENYVTGANRQIVKRYGNEAVAIYKELNYYENKGIELADLHRYEAKAPEVKMPKRIKVAGRRRRY